MKNDKVPQLEGCTHIRTRDLDALKKKLEDGCLREHELKDRYVRLAAEFDNYRKRTEKEKQDIFRYGSERLALQLIPFDEIFEKVLVSLDKNSAHARSVHQGLEMLKKEFLAVLGSLGVKKIETRGKMFDPHLHEAVAAVETAGHKESEIVEEERAGYMLHDKVLRPAAVKVAKAPHENGNSGQG